MASPGITRKSSRSTGSVSGPSASNPKKGIPVDARRSADRLHSLAIHLLRRLRREDDRSGLTSPRLSALSVIVFGGPISLSGLAAAEQVRAPTMSRMIRGLERDGLVRRQPDATDARVVRFSATNKGERILHDGRERRVASLASALDTLSDSSRLRIERVLDTLEEIVQAVK